MWGVAWGGGGKLVIKTVKGPIWPPSHYYGLEYTISDFPLYVAKTLPPSFTAFYRYRYAR